MKNNKYNPFGHEMIISIHLSIENQRKFDELMSLYDSYQSVISSAEFYGEPFDSVSYEWNAIKVIDSFIAEAMDLIRKVSSYDNLALDEACDRVCREMGVN